MKEIDNFKNRLNFSIGENSNKHKINKRIRLKSKSEDEELLLKNQSESEDESDLKLCAQSSVPIRNNAIPLSMICPSKNVGTVLCHLNSHCMKTFSINCLILTIYCGVLVACIVLYVLHKKNCPDVNHFGESTIAIVTYLVLTFGITTCLSWFNWKHTKNLLQQTCVRDKNKKKIGTINKHVIQVTKETQDHVNKLFNEMNKKQIPNLVENIKMGEFISKNRILNNIMTESLATPVKPCEKANEHMMVEAIIHLRSAVGENSYSMANTKNGKNVDKNRKSAFKIFLASAYTLPILTTMFWIHAGINAGNNNSCCTIPFVFFWIITILTTLFSVMQLIPAFCHFINNQKMEAFDKL